MAAAPARVSTWRPLKATWSSTSAAARPEIACISLGGIVCSESINTAGDVFTNDIQSYVRQQHNIRIGERTAEAIKCPIGAAVSTWSRSPRTSS